MYTAHVILTYMITLINLQVEATALGSDALFKSHTSAWARLWASGGVELRGNVTLAAMVS